MAVCLSSADIKEDKIVEISVEDRYHCDQPAEWLTKALTCMFIPSNGKVNTIISATANDAATSSGPWDLPVQFHDMLHCE